MLFYVLLLTLFQLGTSTKKASCIMKLNGENKEVGKVTFSVHGNVQTVEAHLHNKAAITPGLHGFHVHKLGVDGYDCGSSGGHFNPYKKYHGDLGLDTDSRHVGDYGNVLAGERGEINFRAHIMVDPEGEVGSEKIPHEIKCRRKYYCSKKRELLGKCSRKNHCYKAASEIYHYTVNTPRFELEGKNSIVGRAVVLHAGQDDLGQGGDDGSVATGNAGARVACCTLHLEHAHGYGHQMNGQ